MSGVQTFSRRVFIFSCSVRKESELQEGYGVGQKIWSLQKSETWEKEENQSCIYIKIWHHMCETNTKSHIHIVL